MKKLKRIIGWAVWAVLAALVVWLSSRREASAIMSGQFLVDPDFEGA